MIERIISGGQTGADMAGLQAAEAIGLPTGGWMPKGWKTENGPRPDLAKRFNLRESTSEDYRVRTRLNVLESQCTLIIARGPLDGGSMLTAGLCFNLGRGYYHARPDDWRHNPALVRLRIRSFITDNQVKVLNIAGNRESREPGLQAEATVWLTTLFQQLIESASSNRPQKGQGADR